MLYLARSWTPGLLHEFAGIGSTHDLRLLEVAVGTEGANVLYYDIGDIDAVGGLMVPPIYDTSYFEDTNTTPDDYLASRRFTEATVPNFCQQAI